MIRKSILSAAVYPMAVLAMLALPAAAQTQTKSSSCCASKAQVAKVETPAPAASAVADQAVANATDKVIAAKSSDCATQASAQECSTKATECATSSVVKAAECSDAKASQCASSVVKAKSPVALRGQIAQTPAPKRVLAMPAKQVSQNNVLAAHAPAAQAKSACETQAAKTSCCASQGQVVKAAANAGTPTPGLSPAEPNVAANVLPAAKAAAKSDCSTVADCAPQTACSTGAVAKAAPKSGCCSTQQGQVVSAQQGAAPVALGVSSQGVAAVANLPMKAQPSATCAGKVCGGEECNAGACATPSSAVKAAPKSGCCATQGQVVKGAQGQAPTALIVASSTAPKADACGVDQSQCTEAQLAAKSGCCASQGQVAQTGLGQAPAAQVVALGAPVKSAEACTTAKTECTDSVAQKAAKSECCSTKTQAGLVVQAPNMKVPAANVLPVNAAPVKAVPSADCSTSTSCCSQKAQPMAQEKATQSECCSTKTKSSVVRGAAPAAPAAKVIGFAAPAKNAATPAMVKPAAKSEACSSTASPSAAKKSSCCSSQAGKVVESAAGQSVPAANVIKTTKEAGATKEACSSTKESCGDAAKKTDCSTKSSCGSTTKISG